MTDSYAQGVLAKVVQLCARGRWTMLRFVEESVGAIGAAFVLQPAIAGTVNITSPYPTWSDKPAILYSEAIQMTISGEAVAVDRVNVGARLAFDPVSLRAAIGCERCSLTASTHAKAVRHIRGSFPPCFVFACSFAALFLAKMRHTLSSTQGRAGGDCSPATGNFSDFDYTAAGAV